MTDNQIAKIALDCAFEVHSTLGPGLLETVYRECMYYEIRSQGLYVEKERLLPVQYKRISLDYGYRIDILVEKRIVVELKTVEALNNSHIAQTLTYLRLGNFKLGLLLNFNENLLKNGLKRLIL